MDKQNNSFNITNYTFLLETLKNNKLTKSSFITALGKDKNNNIISIDLSKQNLLISGISGCGKTSLILSILINLMVQNKPEELRIIGIDSMGVDYNEIMNTNYALIKTNEPSKYNSEDLLNFIIQETNNRLNSKKHSPRIICVIDDFADIQTDCEIKKSNKFNEFIKLIPIMNKVGIYVIFSTSRTTKSIITDYIKDNFINKIAFTVSNSIDSLTIIDEVGAENLNNNNYENCILKSNKNIEYLRCFYIDPQDIKYILQELEI